MKLNCEQSKIFTVDDTDLTEGTIVRLDEESKAIKKDEGM